MLADLIRDDTSDDDESAEKVLNGAGVEDPKKDCCPKLKGAADEPMKPSWTTFEPKNPAGLAVELYAVI
ncbi:hypothetical protein FWK35_00031549, partial [Aphis craccivora]